MYSDVRKCVCVYVYMCMCVCMSWAHHLMTTSVRRAVVIIIAGVLKYKLHTCTCTCITNTHGEVDIS